MSTPEGTYFCAEHGTPGPLGKKAWQATGDFRPPVAGEWYIASSTRRRLACRAAEDIAAPQWIAVEVAP